MPPITDKVSRHFRWSEVVGSQIAARRGIANVPTLAQCENIEFAANHLDLVRDYLRGPVLPSSWFRSLLLNKAVGGGKASDHLEGWAIDFECPSYGPPEAVIRAVMRSQIPFHKLILEYPQSPGGGWVHASFQPELAGIVLVTHDGKRYDPLH